MKISEVALGITLVCAALPCPAQEAVLHGTIRDNSTGRPSACTIAITDARGNLLTESDAFKAGFRCEGQFTKKLPTGRTRIRIARGFETRFVEEEIDLKPGSSNEVTFALNRICDLRK